MAADTSSSSPPFCIALDTWNGKATNPNFGTAIRCGVAFGCYRMLVVGVGRPRFSTHGSFGAAKYLPVRTFSNWEMLRQEMEKEGWSLIGIQRAHDAETLHPSTPVHERPFKGPTVFITPAKGYVLNPEQRAACHSFVHVSISPIWQEEFATEEATLDADVALSIALQHYTSWAQSTANEFSGAKYVLGNPGRLGDVDECEKRRLQEVRRRQRQEADVMEKEEEVLGGGLWGTGEEGEEDEEDHS